MKMLSPLLEKLNSFFELDTRKILGRASYLLGSQAISNLLSFGVALVAAHYLTKDTYGTYRYILSTVSFIAAFSLTGLSTAIVRSSARGFDELYATSLSRSLRWALPAIICGIGAGVWYLAHGNQTLGYSVLMGSIIFPIIQALLLYRSYLNGKELFRMLMVSNAVYSIITSLAIAGAMTLRAPILVLIGSYYASNLVATALITFFVRKKYPPNNEKDAHGKKLEHHMSIMNILDSGATQLDKVILYQVAGPVEVARYVFATLIPEQLRNVMKYTSTLSMPVFSNLPFVAARAKGLFLVRKLFLITVPLVVVYILIAPLLYSFLFPQYQDSVFYSQLFSLILLFDGGIAGTVMKAKNQVKKLYVANIVSNVSKIVLLFVLGITLGIAGVVLSRIISRIIGFILSYVLLHTTHHES